MSKAVTITLIIVGGFIILGLIGAAITPPEEKATVEAPRVEQKVEPKPAEQPERHVNPLVAELDSILADQEALNERLETAVRDCNLEEVLDITENQLAITDRITAVTNKLEISGDVSGLEGKDVELGHLIEEGVEISEGLLNC